MQTNITVRVSIVGWRPAILYAATAAISGNQPVLKTMVAARDCKLAKGQG